jgi:hypothetical protein
MALLAPIAWRKRSGRPANVPATAVFVDGNYIDCIPSTSGFGQPCKVYDRSTGKIVDTDPFTIRLNAFSTRHGGSLVDCGRTSAKTPDAGVADCAKTAFQNRRPFAVQYFTDFRLFSYAYALGGDAKGNVAMVTYDSRGFPAVPPTPRTELLDGNRIRLNSCVAPVTFGMTEDGVLACITPVNEKASVSGIGQEPIDTTVCAITENPAAFNNKLVRIRGHVSGNFEFSMLSGDGCSGSTWFDYGSDDSPPGLVAHVPGGATPGAEDEEGRRILPVPVSLLRDRNFHRFQRLMKARVEADKRYSKLNPGEFISHQVTATFVGRIDGVSPEIHQFHLKHSDTDRADFLGFGQMGLFDTQLIMQSVEGDAVLETERPTSSSR